MEGSAGPGGSVRLGQLDAPLLWMLGPLIEPIPTLLSAFVSNTRRSVAARSPRSRDARPPACLHPPPRLGLSPFARFRFDDAERILTSDVHLPIMFFISVRLPVPF